MCIRDSIYTHLIFIEYADKIKHLFIIDNEIIPHSLARTCKELRAECGPILDCFTQAHMHATERLDVKIRDFDYSLFYSAIEGVQVHHNVFKENDIPILHTVRFHVELTDPALWASRSDAGGREGLRGWLNRHKVLRNKRIFLRYLVTFDWECWTVEQAEGVVEEIWLNELLAGKERFILREAMQGAVGERCAVTGKAPKGKWKSGGRRVKGKTVAVRGKRRRAAEEEDDDYDGFE